jgi:hypothetical protein
VWETLGDMDPQSPLFGKVKTYRRKQRDLPLQAPWLAPKYQYKEMSEKENSQIPKFPKNEKLRGLKEVDKNKIIKKIPVEKPIIPLYTPTSPVHHVSMEKKMEKHGKIVKLVKVKPLPENQDQDELLLL